MNGIININKPEGITSYGVIARLKRVTGEKKAGHIGTLDPLATGVLPVFLGKMTKLIPYFNGGNKAYDVALRLGASSTTLDREGDITPVPIPENCTEARIREKLTLFLGEIEQIPPMFSAIKHQGKKLYDYARQGIEISRPPRKITIYSIDNIRYAAPEVYFSVHCSKGTYIRTLGDDLAKELGTAGYLTGLERTQCEKHFNLDNASELDQIERLTKNEIAEKFIDPETLLPHWHVIKTDSKQVRDHLGDGRSVSVPLSQVKLSSEGRERAEAMVKNQDNHLLAIGFLEFSQDFQCIFIPSKVLL